MILDDVLELNWDASGIQCYSYEEAWIVHKFMREAIMDRHVYLSKVSSFSITSAFKFAKPGIKSIARHPQIGESYIEIMKNLQDKIFFTNAKSLSIELACGVNNISNVVVKDTGSNSVVNLHVTDEICRCLTQTATLKIRLFYGCGYRDMAVNSEGLTAGYFPCIQDYNLQPYVRVCPLPKGTTKVPMRYYNGLSPALLKLSIFTKWQGIVKARDITEEELKWLSGFEHLA